MRLLSFILGFCRWALLIALVLAGLVTLVSGLISTWVRRREPGKGGLTWKQTLVGLMREWLATTFLFLLYPLGFLPWWIRPDPRDPRPPVLFVHGYSMNRSTWFWFAWRLRRRGYKNIFAINLPFFTSIDKDADLLHQEMERHNDDLKGGRWVLIGHSMGGLVIRTYIKKYGSGRVLRAYTLGSPHEGTYMARLGQGKNAREMIPGSPFLHGLSEGEDPKVMICIASRLDNLVVPWRNALHRSAPGLILSQPIGHNHLVLHPQVFRAVVADLEFFQKS